MENLVSSARVAQHLGVTRAAVSNWRQRDILPERLKPVRTEPVPLWVESQLDELAAWYASRKRPAPKSQLDELAVWHAGRLRLAPNVKPDKLLAYVRAAKQAAAVKGHLGLDEDNYWMGAAWAYQDIEGVLVMKAKQRDTETPDPQ